MYLKTGLALLIWAAICLAPWSSYAADVDLLWAHSFGSIRTDRGFDITVDAAGNVYTTGTFDRTVDFDPDPNNTVHLTGSRFENVFVQKLDANGDLVWVRGVSGWSLSAGYGVAVDHFENVYITGFFRGTVDFDPGPGTHKITSNGLHHPGYDVNTFVWKLDANGDFVWVRSLGGAGNRGWKIAVDSAGNVYYTGYFFATVDFDPGPGSYHLTSAWNQDIYVSKLNSDGDFIWARRMGGLGNDQGTDIAVDNSGNVFTSGFVFDVLDIDTGTGDFKMFLQKLDGNGNLLWSHILGGPGYDYTVDIAVDGAGNVYTTGTFQMTVDFDPGPGTFNLTSAGDRDNFLLKLSAGGDFLWVKTTGGPGYASTGRIAVDEAGNVYRAGRFDGTVDFDPGFGIFNLTSASASARDFYISKLNANGHFVWAKSMGGADDASTSGLAIDGTGNAYVTGFFEKTAHFGVGTGAYDLTSSGSDDLFVLKLSIPPDTLSPTVPMPVAPWPLFLAIGAAGCVLLHRRRR